MRREALRLALPALGALAADPLVSLVDTAFVGRLGTTELGALGVNAAVFGIAFALFNFLAYGTTPLVAAAVGRGDEGGARSTVRTAFFLALTLGVATAAVLELAAPAILRLMRAAPHVQAAGLEYLRIRALAVPAVLLILAAHGAYRGNQDTRTPLKVTLGLNMVNLVLDPLLIFAAGWGMAGAAVATVVAQWVGAVWFLGLLRAELHAVSADRETRRRLLLAGWSLTLRTASLLGVFGVATAVAAGIDTATVAAHQVLGQVWLFLALVVDALAVAGQALVGRSAGRADLTQARSVTFLLARWGVGMGLALMAALLLLGDDLARLFTEDPEVRVRIAGGASVVAWMQSLGALVFVGDGVYLGAARFRFLAITTTVAAVLTMPFLLTSKTIDRIWWSIALLLALRLAAQVTDFLRGGPLAPVVSRAVPGAEAGRWFRSRPGR